jgi:nitric oxide reductase subunit B
MMWIISLEVSAMSDLDTTSTPLSPWWRHATILVLIAGFSVLIMLTVMTYKGAPPIPNRVVDDSGKNVFTGEDILHGQEVFLKYALMEHGTLWGHGAYLGPDYTAEYLHREAILARGDIAKTKFGKAFAELSPGDQAAVSEQVKSDLKQNRYDAAGGRLTFGASEAESFRAQVGEWGSYFSSPTAAPGLPSVFIKDPQEVRALTAYFAWASWAARVHRPGKNYTYTNNFPYDPMIGNVPPAAAYLWSALSLITLLGGLGLVLFLFGKFDYLGWREEGAVHAHPAEGEVAKLTGSQWVTGWYFGIVVVLFLLQALLGGALAHYRVEPNGFYGFDLAKLFPYNLARTWHLQLAVFWVATAWVGGGLFFAPMIAGAEPGHQKLGVWLLLAALVVVVLGSLVGELLGIRDLLGKWWFWFGHQGSEYLDLGRFWQLLLAAGLTGWLVLMFRALRPAMKDRHKSELSSLFLYATIAIPLFYVPALFYGARTNFAIIDHWRFWIIHLWVEGFFELFATVLVAVMFAHLGVVSLKTATRVVYLDAILYLGGGIVGTAHHWYFTGQPAVAMALGAMFSAMEVVPLTLLTLDAWDFIRLTKGNCPKCGVQLTHFHKWAMYFLMAVGVWNFVGAGVFGFLINLPIVSYFQVGTTLTPNHGHAAMFGVFGMLALAVVVFCMRSMQNDEAWKANEKYFRVGFWGLNVGLGLMVVLDLFPGGVLQLWDCINNGYWHCRSLAYTMSGTFHTLEWVRLVGDATFIVAGVIPFTIGTLLSLVRRNAAHA